MLTVTSAANELISLPKIIEEVRRILREIDPEYPVEEVAYKQSIQAIQDQFPEAMNLVSLQEQTLASGILLLLWEGLHLNLDCFHHPVTKSFLQVDIQNLLREEVLQAMPYHRYYEISKSSFYQNLSATQQELMEPIASYYIYIQTVAYKLAHFYGFALGDLLLPHVIPGYAASPVLTRNYYQELQKYLQVDLHKLIA